MTEHGHVRNDGISGCASVREQRERPRSRTRIRGRSSRTSMLRTPYADSLLAPLKNYRETLFKEMKGRVKEEDLSVPYRENGYWYNHRFELGRNILSTCGPGRTPMGACPTSWRISSTRTRWPGARLLRPRRFPSVRKTTSARTVGHGEPPIVTPSGSGTFPLGPSSGCDHQHEWRWRGRTTGPSSTVGRTRPLRNHKHVPAHLGTDGKNDVGREREGRRVQL